MFTKDNLRNTFSAWFSDQQVDRINKMYNHLKSLGWSQRNIAAVLGNIMAESTFNYRKNPKSSAEGAFQMIQAERDRYDKWRTENKYNDGPLSQASFYHYIILNRIDPRYDLVLNARKLLLNKNRIDSINANKTLDWAEPALKNGTFYPISDLSDALDDNTIPLDDITLFWHNTIEKSGDDDLKLKQRQNYARKFYKLISGFKKFGGTINYLKFFEK